ncbi:MAG: hypothetical protein HQM08_09730 [Candidatus Riflebacteria bacterium]|nr:hypothetical protein [Candidatus Riflebacteria bacterium]
MISLRYFQGMLCFICVMSMLAPNCFCFAGSSETMSDRIFAETGKDTGQMSTNNVNRSDSSAIYAAPEIINSELQLEPSPDNGTVVMAGKVLVRVGTIKNVEIRFTCSSDFEINFNPKNLSELASGATHVEKLTVRTSQKSLSKGRSWVKMHVSYFPDFEALKKEIEKDKITYSNDSLRGILLKNIDKENQSHKKDSSVVGYLFTKPPFSGKGGVLQ